MQISQPMHRADPDRPAAAEQWMHTTSRDSFGNHRKLHMGQQRLQQGLQQQQAVLLARYSHKKAAGVSSCYPGCRCHVVSNYSSLSACMLAFEYETGKLLVDKRTTWSTFSQMARLASSIAWRVPTRPISRSMSAPEAWDTLILHPVSDCIDLMVSPPA